MLGHLGTLCIKEYCTHKAEKVFGFRGKKGFNFCKNFRDKQLWKHMRRFIQQNREAKYEPKEN